jgi:hypothetical protein
MNLILFCSSMNILSKEGDGQVETTAVTDDEDSLQKKKMLENFLKIKMSGKIVTTKGDEWELKGENIQLAVNSLDSGPVVGQGQFNGTVFIGGDIHITKPIMPKNGIKIDFLGHNVMLDTDTTFIYCTSCSDSAVRNVNVNLYPTQTQPVIHLHTYYNYPTQQWATNRIARNYFENIQMKNTGGMESIIIEGKKNNVYIYRNYEALLIDVDQNAPILANVFRNIIMEGVKTAIHLWNRTSQHNAWGNSNTFDTIFCGHGYTNGIWIEVAEGKPPHYSFVGNYFNNVKLQTRWWFSEYGMIVEGVHNTFNDCFAWDWYPKVQKNLPQPYDWIIKPTARETYIFGKVWNVLDNGKKTQIFGPLKTN